MKKNGFSLLEVCAGGGGQSLGLEEAGFFSELAVENDPKACATLRHNRPGWRVFEGDLQTFCGHEYRGIDLLAGGLPCPPFSIAGKQQGHRDERDLFPPFLRLVSEIQPKSFLIENVRGFLSKAFEAYRRELFSSLSRLGYGLCWSLLDAADFGVPQHRTRFFLVGFREGLDSFFSWPTKEAERTTVAESLGEQMLSKGWLGGPMWLEKARGLAPTLVGGSKKHGGADLGPTRARKAWAALGIDGRGLAEEPPGVDFPFDGKPRLTLSMASRIQGFPDSWVFCGKKTSAYRQIGNALPPPLARAIGRAIREAFEAKTKGSPVRLGGRSPSSEIREAC